MYIFVYIDWKHTVPAMVTIKWKGKRFNQHIEDALIHSGVSVRTIQRTVLASLPHCSWGLPQTYTRMDHKDTQGILYVLVKSFFLSFHCDHSWNLSMIQYENKYCNILLLLYFQIIVDHQKWPPSKATWTDIQMLPFSCFAYIHS